MSHANRCIDFVYLFDLFYVIPRMFHLYNVGPGYDAGKLGRDWGNVMIRYLLTEGEVSMDETGQVSMCHRDETREALCVDGKDSLIQRMVSTRCRFQHPVFAYIKHMVHLPRIGYDMKIKASCFLSQNSCTFLEYMHNTAISKVARLWIAYTYPLSGVN